jgi:hypothetical protein
MSAPYTDPDSGSNYATYAAFLDTVAYTPLGGNDLEINGETSSFSYVDPGGKGSLSWDASSETLTIDGIIKIDGDIVMGDEDAGQDDALSAIKYAGTGSLWAEDDIEINQDVYPVGQYMADGPDADGAVDGSLGFITDGEIRIDAGSPSGNVQLFATLFAEERLDIRSRVNIAGAVVTSHIDIAGNRNLSVWYVPGLAAAAPPGMPGAAGVPTISVRLTDWFQRR